MTVRAEVRWGAKKRYTDAPTVCESLDQKKACCRLSALALILSELRFMNRRTHR
jgi:hypothetical protein